jgi:hypothetical protein
MTICATKNHDWCDISAGSLGNLGVNRSAIYNANHQRRARLARPLDDFVMCFYFYCLKANLIA